MRAMIKRVLVCVGLALAGCAGSSIVSDNRIDVREPIVFANGSDALPMTAATSIDKIAGALTDHPSILKVAIEGHTGPTDGEVPADRLALGKRRAQAVVAQLATRGIAPARLEASAVDDGTQAIRVIIVQRKADEDDTLHSGNAPY